MPSFSGDIERGVGAEDADQRDVLKIQALGDHLGAEQDRDLFFFKLPQELFVPMRRADRVGVHAQDLRSGEQSVQLLLDLLRTGADVLHDAAALRAAFIGRLTVAAVMAHQPSISMLRK